jgi:PAS domain S-box-containing protein
MARLQEPRRTEPDVQLSLAILPFIASTGILAMLAIYGWLFRNSRAATIFGFSMLIATIDSLVYGLHLTAAGVDARILYLQLTILVSAFLPLLFLAVALAYTGHAGWLSRARVAALLVVPTVNIAMVMTSRLHDLSLTGFRPVSSAFANGMTFSAGPWEIVNVVFNYCLMLAALAVLLGSGGQLDRGRRHGARLMAAALCVASGFHVLFRLGISPVPGINYAPAALAVTGSAMAAALFRVRLLDVSPIASRTLVETMDSLVMVVSTRGRLVDCNPRARAVLGLDAAALLGRAVTSLPAPWPELLQPPPAGAPPRAEVTVASAAGGELTLLAAREHLRSQRGRLLGWLVVLHDVTALKQAEEALRVSRRQLEQAQKMEAIGRLAGGIAHDFNNLLTVIAGFSELALAETGTGHALHSHLVQISRAAERAASLTRQLLAFSRRQMLRPQLIDLAGLVKNMVGMLERVISEDVRLAFALDPRPLTVLADPHQVEQVIMNLAVNARDAMPGGGTLTLGTAQRRVPDAGDAEHPEMRPGEYATITVSDTGRGMDTDALAHLFEPFYTTKESGKGTGLGLPTAFGIVKQSGGYIYGTNGPDGGAVFSVFLPLVAEASAPQPARERPPGSTGRGETLLLVEDEPSVRSYARAVLESAGYVVIEADTGGRALAAVEECAVRPNLLVTDVVMPGMGGLELAERLAAVFPGIRVLYLSGYTEDPALRRIEPGAGTAFLGKPFDAAALLGSIRRLLDGEGR